MNYKIQMLKHDSQQKLMMIAIQSVEKSGIYIFFSNSYCKS